MGAQWDYGLQLNAASGTQELLAQLEFCGAIPTEPRRCDEYASTYFFRPPLATLATTPTKQVIFSNGSESPLRNHFATTGHGELTGDLSEQWPGEFRS